MKVLVADAINEKGIENLKEVAEVTVDTSITPEDLQISSTKHSGAESICKTAPTAYISPVIPATAALSGRYMNASAKLISYLLTLVKMHLHGHICRRTRYIRRQTKFTQSTFSQSTGEHIFTARPRGISQSTT